MVKKVKVKAAPKETVAEKLNRAYEAVLSGLRTSLLAAKAYGVALVEARKQMGFNDTKLFAWVRENTTCKLGDTTLAGYKRLAENWADLELLLGEESLQTKTLVQALDLCRKHKRKSTFPKSGPVKTSANNASNPSSTSVTRHPKATNRSSNSAQSKAPPSMDWNCKDGPKEKITPVIMLTKVVGSLKEAVSAPIKGNEKKQVEVLIKEALRLIGELQEKLAS